MTNIYKYILFIISIGSFFSCASSKPAKQMTKTLTINSQQIDCNGVAAQKCLQIKEDGSTEWNTFYGSIEGFEYQEGNTYQIEVSISEVENPPADASSLNYKLVKILKETKDPYASLAGTWVIDAINGNTADPIVTYISFDPSKNRIDGYAGCNGLGSNMSYDAEKNTIKAGPFMSTMMFCEEVAANERALSKILENFNRFTIDGDELTLYQDDKMLVKAKKGVNHRDLIRNWKVTEVEGVVSLNGNIPDIFFDKDGKAYGSGSCNKFNGRYTIDAYSKNIKIGPLMSTKMMCGDNKVESVFFIQVNTVDHYEIVGKELHLYSGDKVVIKATR